MKAAAASLAVILLCSCAHRALIGTWRLVEYWNQPRGQPRQYPFGEQPVGYFVYDETGHVLIQVARKPELPRLTRTGYREASCKELVTMMDAFISYFGTYTIDAAKGIVIHHVEADSRREYFGTDQERPFQLAGDELRIGDGKTWLRRLTRVK